MQTWAAAATVMRGSGGGCGMVSLEGVGAPTRSGGLASVTVRSISVCVAAVVVVAML
jgi:hypothetical protein